MIAGDIPDLPEYADLKSIRVHAPTTVIFVCGGKVDIKSLVPLSLRDALFRVLGKSFLAKYDVRMAEDMEIFFPHGGYDELLKFESDIAQISELIILFSESDGSLAELGVFVMDDEIAPRMLVFVDSKNYSRDSFIKLGPLYTLSKAHGEDCVAVINLSDIGIVDIKFTQNTDLNAFLRAVDGSIKYRLRRRADPRTFDPTRNGHLIKLITGLIQHYSSLTIDEIDVLLYSMNVNIRTEEIKKLLHCSEIFGWIISSRRGLNTYYSAVSENLAIHFEFISEIPAIDRRRWRADILQHWRSNEPDRFKSIQEAAQVKS